MGTSQSSEKKKRVLIIGASFSGLYLYKAISQLYDVYVVDTKDYFEYTPSIHFALISGRSHDRMCFKYEDSIISQDHFVFGKVTELRNNSAVIKTMTGQTTLEFDYCVICTGSIYASPTKIGFELTTFERRQEQVKAVREEIARAKTILVKGSGIVGVEIAGELAYRRKNVYLSCHDGKVVKNLCKKAQDKTKTHLQRIGVTLVDAKSITKEEETSSKYDMVYDCTGNKYPIEDNILNKHFKQCRDDQGRVRVNKYMQICDENYATPVSHIFAIGDGCITPANECKVVLHAKLGVSVAAHNLKELASKKSGKAIKLKEFPTDKKKTARDSCSQLGQQVNA